MYNLAKWPKNSFCRSICCMLEGGEGWLHTPKVNKRSSTIFFAYAYDIINFKQHIVSEENLSREYIFIMFWFRWVSRYSFLVVLPFWFWLYLGLTWKSGWICGRGTSACCCKGCPISLTSKMMRMIKNISSIFCIEKLTKHETLTALASSGNNYSLKTYSEDLPIL